MDARRVGAGGSVCDAIPGGVVFVDGAVCGGAGRGAWGGGGYVESVGEGGVVLVRD